MLEGDDMDSIVSIKSRKNGSVYHVYDSKIEVTTMSGLKYIELPFDPSDTSYYVRFSDAYYINDKLYAIVIVRDPYDVRFEIDEDRLELKGPPIPTY